MDANAILNQLILRWNDITETLDGAVADGTPQTVLTVLDRAQFDAGKAVQQFAEQHPEAFDGDVWAML